MQDFDGASKQNKPNLKVSYVAYLVSLTTSEGIRVPRLLRETQFTLFCCWRSRMEVALNDVQLTVPCRVCTISRCMPCGSNDECGGCLIVDKERCTAVDKCEETTPTTQTATAVSPPDVPKVSSNCCPSLTPSRNVFNLSRQGHLFSAGWRW